MTARAGREEQFRRLFADEAAERLARLGRQLLELEHAGEDDELIASIFRDAHTLKGSAAVVGADDMARVAHRMEDVLEEMRGHRQQPTTALIDTLLGATDALTAMIPAMLEGVDQSAVATAVEQRFDALGPALSLPAVAVAAPAAAATDVATTPWAPVAPPVAGATRPGAGAGAGATRPDATTMLVPVRRLDELVRLVGESAAAQLRLGEMLATHLDVDPATLPEFRELSRRLNDLQERTMRARMVPVATITDGLQRAVRDLSHTLGKSVNWVVRGGDTELDRGVLQELADPLLHLVRNAVGHGIESDTARASAGKPVPATILLEAAQLGSEVIITLGDDGQGIDLDRVRERAAAHGGEVAELSDEEALQLIFRSGLSTAPFVTGLSGRGVGLDAVRASVDAIRGRIEVRAERGRGTEFRIVVPITLAVLRCLLVGVGEERYAIPMHSVAAAKATAAVARLSVEGRPMVWVGEAPVPAWSLARTLWGASRPDSGDVVVVLGTARRHAFFVDRILGQRDVVVKGLTRLVPRLEVFVGASVEPDGSILLVLDGAGLISHAEARHAPHAEAAPGTRDPGGAATVLVVDDSVIVRQLERSILERAGYQVVTAADGVEALAALAANRCDVVLADLEMPRMDGIALTAGIRADPRLTNVPVLIITTQSSNESRARALQAGADGFIVKSAFDEAALLAAVSRLLGTTP